MLVLGWGSGSTGSGSGSRGLRPVIIKEVHDDNGVLGLLERGRKMGHLFE